MNLKLLVIPFLIATAGCSTQIEGPWRGVSLFCQGNTCPPQSEVARAVEFFEKSSGGFFARETLDVYWYDDNSTFPPRTLAYTENANEVHVTNQRLLMHELMHVKLWRNPGDPDRNHEAPGGPWTAEMNEEIRVIELALEAEQASVSECLGLPLAP